MSPLLFVIGMEYLSRILKVAGEAKSFSYHPRCSKLNLNHLVFADDLMLFCKGDMPSIQTFCQGVHHFSTSSGLEANYSKSSIYLARVSDHFRRHAASTLDFSFESLPVKYLGMPLTSKRYNVADCEYLVDKMTSRIRSWVAKNLSYTARL
jgi:reverse transcriptase-like protein